jgi:hypothetical protein
MNILFASASQFDFTHGAFTNTYGYSDHRAAPWNSLYTAMHPHALGTFSTAQKHKSDDGMRSLAASH